MGKPGAAARTHANDCCRHANGGAKQAPPQWHVFVYQRCSLSTVTLIIVNICSGRHSSAGVDNSRAFVLTMLLRVVLKGDDSYGECGVPTAARFHMPDNGNKLFWCVRWVLECALRSAIVLPFNCSCAWFRRWIAASLASHIRQLFRYSFDKGNVHFTSLSMEHDFLPGSEQCVAAGRACACTDAQTILWDVGRYEWLVRDLAAVNRSVTPWLVAGLHRPPCAPLLARQDARTAVV